jgi:hypothetical protein
MEIAGGLGLLTYFGWELLKVSLFWMEIAGGLGLGLPILDGNSGGGWSAPTMEPPYFVWKLLKV